MTNLAKVNKLVEIFAKANYAVEMVEQAQDSAHHPGGLWYHAIAMFNGYYAIIEELLNRTKNGSDSDLSAAVDSWWDANRQKANSYFQRERNVVTHQGEIEVEYINQWEIDHWNDTERPFRSARVSIKSSLSIQDMPATEFLALCKPAMEFIRGGIIAIDKDYKSRGGQKHALPEPGDLSLMFNELKL
ncbi:hypothetical protein [Mesorhizobium shangrilense]|uniref:AbiV family abortive infection protein n=1 Tax=Mesorhizobium shangrilense TaxID=460060 RepID=A0ABV2DIB7_9HYPH